MWNCRHVAMSIVIGVMQPNYTDEQLQDILDKNEEGYTFPDGRHLTMYECTQEQRRMETEIRYAKDGQMTAMAAGNMELAKEYQAEVNRLTKEYRAFSKACGLSPKLEKIRVEGYEKIPA